MKLAHLDPWNATPAAGGGPVYGTALPTSGRDAGYLHRAATISSTSTPSVCRQRDALAAAPEGAGDPPRHLLPVPLHLQKAFASLGGKPGRFSRHGTGGGRK